MGVQPEFTGSVTQSLTRDSRTEVIHRVRVCRNVSTGLTHLTYGPYYPEFVSNTRLNKFSYDLQEPPDCVTDSSSAQEHVEKTVGFLGRVVAYVKPVFYVGEDPSCIPVKKNLSSTKGIENRRVCPEIFPPLLVRK